jgi:hypothetical protein
LNKPTTFNQTSKKKYYKQKQQWRVSKSAKWKRLKGKEYKPGGVTYITASRSKGQSISDLTELLQNIIVYAAHQDPGPGPATPNKRQAVDASSQKKRPLNYFPMPSLLPAIQ